MIGLLRSGAPLLFGQKNVTLIVSASQARVVGGSLLTFDTVIVYVSVEPFTTKPVGSWMTMSFRAVSLQPAGDCEFGLLERTWVTRRATSTWPVGGGAARRCALWARAWSERSTMRRTRPRTTVATPADFRKDEVRDRPVPGVDLTRPPDTRRARHPYAPAWPDPTCTQNLTSRWQSALMHLRYAACFRQCARTARGRGVIPPGTPDSASNGAAAHEFPVERPVRAVRMHAAPGAAHRRGSCVSSSRPWARTSRPTCACRAMDRR